MAKGRTLKSICAALAAALFCLAAAGFAPSRLPRGCTVGGVDVSGKTLAAAAAIRDHTMRMLTDLDERTRTDLWRDAVLNPRVDGEELAGDHRVLQQRFDADRTALFRSDPRTLWQEMLFTLG